MDRSQLSLILSWADAPVRRSHLQKVVYCLQEAGWELGCHFALLRNGVYSAAVMDACDDLAASGLALETFDGGHPAIRPRQDILDVVAREFGDEAAEFLGRRLLRVSPDELRNAATVLFFRKENRGWENGARSALVYHQLTFDAAKAADSLARSIMENGKQEIKSMECSCEECGKVCEVAVEIQVGKSIWRFCSEECNRKWRDSQGTTAPGLTGTGKLPVPGPGAPGGWTSVKDKLHPDKPGLSHYEQVPCLVVKSGEILLRQWNCEHEVWDTEDGDDFYCKASDVTHWMIVPPLPEQRQEMEQSVTKTRGRKLRGFNPGS